MLRQLCHVRSPSLRLAVSYCLWLFSKPVHLGMSYFPLSASLSLFRLVLKPKLNYLQENFQFCFINWPVLKNLIRVEATTPGLAWNEVSESPTEFLWLLSVALWSCIFVSFITNSSRVIFTFQPWETCVKVQSLGPCFHFCVFFSCQEHKCWQGLERRGAPCLSLWFPDNRDALDSTPPRQARSQGQQGCWPLRESVLPTGI